MNENFKEISKELFDVYYVPILCNFIDENIKRIIFNNFKSKISFRYDISYLNIPKSAVYLLGNCNFVDDKFLSYKKEREAYRFFCKNRCDNFTKILNTITSDEYIYDVMVNNKMEF